ncbi:PRC-barrel domain-containing protein [Roseivirga ehrenbergii]|nr:PRC-barrel domain-containing protein [Roseivirga ehrenbergii]
MTNYFISVSDLKNSDVLTPAHDHIGKIEDIVIHQGSERVAYVILKVNTGFWGIDSKHIPVPFGAFYLDSDEDKKVILNADVDKLKKAPSIDETKSGVDEYTQFIWNMYNYYDLQPYLVKAEMEPNVVLDTPKNTGPSTIEEASFKTSRFDSSHKSVRDRHKSHYGL